MSASPTKASAGGRTHTGKWSRLRSRPWWRPAKTAIYLLFLAGVTWLIVSQARNVNWDDVLAAMQRRPLSLSLLAAALAAASFALYSCFDLLGRRYTGHKLPTRRVMTVNFISYAFNLNLGSLIGGAAFRYRLYLRLGLDLATITRVLLFSMLTNWLGYFLLAGLVLIWQAPQPPPDWPVNAATLPALGVLLVLVPVAYLVLCIIRPGRSWTVRGHEFTLPPAKLATVQLLISSTNWLLMGATVYMLLQQQIGYVAVLGVLLAAAVAGVITHVPAGLGVLEATFIVLLSGSLPSSELLAAILSYRVIYYFAPLLAAVLAYVFFELRRKKR